LGGIEAGPWHTGTPAGSALQGPGLILGGQFVWRGGRRSSPLAGKAVTAHPRPGLLTSASSIFLGLVVLPVHPELTGIAEPLLDRLGSESSVEGRSAGRAVPRRRQHRGPTRSMGGLSSKFARSLFDPHGPAMSFAPPASTGKRNSSAGLAPGAETGPGPRTMSARRGGHVLEKHQAKNVLTGSVAETGPAWPDQLREHLLRTLLGVGFPGAPQPSSTTRGCGCRTAGPHSVPGPWSAGACAVAPSSDVLVAGSVRDSSGHFPRSPGACAMPTDGDPARPSPSQSCNTILCVVETCPKVPGPKGKKRSAARESTGARNCGDTALPGGRIRLQPVVPNKLAGRTGARGTRLGLFLPRRTWATAGPPATFSLAVPNLSTGRPGTRSFYSPVQTPRRCRRPSPGPRQGPAGR